MGTVSWLFKWPWERDNEGQTLTSVEVFFKTLACSIMNLLSLVRTGWKWFLYLEDSSFSCVASFEGERKQFKNHLYWKINLFNKQTWNQFSMKAANWECKGEWSSPEHTCVLEPCLYTRVWHSTFSCFLRMNMLWGCTCYSLGLHSAPFLKVKLLTVAWAA